MPDPSRPPDHPAPYSIGRYRVRRVLGAGAMGTVYLAHDPQLDRPVALKVPQFEGGARPVLIERFVREARAAATLSHPNICPVYDAGEADGVPYMAMAYVEGKSLADLVNGGQPLPERAVVAVIRQLALAMQHAHDHGVIHRDLKPANVMVTADRKPVVMDFGLARRAVLSADETRLTQTGALLGTPAYMSPEQVSGDPAAVGPASDQYSLGVILYELLAGRRPFQGAVGAVLGQIALDPPPPPSQFRPGVDRGLQAICLKAMAKRPEGRFASMAAFAAALGSWSRGSAPVVAVPVSADPSPASVFAEIAAAADRPRPPAPPPRRRPELGVWAAGGVVALGLVATAVMFSRGPAKTEYALNQPGEPVAKPRPLPPRPTLKAVPEIVPDPRIETKEDTTPERSETPPPPPPDKTDPPPMQPVKPAPPTRDPIPDKAALTTAERTVREAYKADLARHERSARLELANRLTRAAAAEAGNPPLRFALLRAAEDVAAQSGGGREALTAADELARIFAVEPFAEKVKALAASFQGLVRMETKKALGAAGPRLHQELADLAAGLADEAAAAEDYNQAANALRLVEDTARRAKNTTQLTRALAERGDVEELVKLHKKVREAEATLAESPGDPAASLVVGKYLAERRGRWGEALPHLARGNDPGWRAAAAADLAAPPTGTEQADLADRWRALAAASLEPGKAALLRRAARWYERAADGLSRPDEQPRLKVVRQRLREIDAPPDPDRSPPTVDVVYDAADKAPPEENRDKKTGHLYWESGYATGRHFIAAAPNCWYWWNYADRPDDYVVRVVGRTVGPRAANWEVSPVAKEDKTYVEFLIDGDGALHIKPSDDLIASRMKPEVIRHRAIRSHNRFNTVVVVGRGLLLDLFVNGERVRETLTLPRAFGAGSVWLGIATGPDGGRVEFERLTVWKNQ